MRSLPRACRRFLAGPCPPPDPAGVFRGAAGRFTVAQTLVRACYVFLLYLAVLQVTELSVLVHQRLDLPLWPVAWLGASGSLFPAGVKILFFGYLGSNVLAAVLPGWRSLRVAAFLGLLEYVALKNSFGKISHSFHLPLLVSGLLVFLPAGWDRRAAAVPRATRQATLLVFWLCQAGVLLSYTMSGLGKLGGALYQLAASQPNAFEPGALGTLVALRLLQTHSQSELGAWIIHHPWVTWPSFPVVIYLELFSFWIAFRPALQRPWAATLIVFHLGTFFTMTITFPQSSFLLALLLFQSPFAPERFPGWQTLLFQLPLAGEVLKMLPSPRGRTTEPGAGNPSVRQTVR